MVNQLSITHQIVINDAGAKIVIFVDEIEQLTKPTELQILKLFFVA
jgi:hypothetical protein